MEIYKKSNDPNKSTCDYYDWNWIYWIFKQLIGKDCANYLLYNHLYNLVFRQYITHRCIYVTHPDLTIKRYFVSKKKAFEIYKKSNGVNQFNYGVTQFYYCAENTTVLINENFIS